MNLRLIRDFFDRCVQQHPDIEGLIFAVNEKHAILQLGKSRDGIQLLVTYPTSEATGPNDSNRQTHALMVSVLERGNSEGKTADEEFEQFVRLRELIEWVRQQIADAFSEGLPPWRGLDVEKNIIRSEYSIKDWNGWSCDVVF